MTGADGLQLVAAMVEVAAIALVVTRIAYPSQKTRIASIAAAATAIPFIEAANYMQTSLYNQTTILPFIIIGCKLDKCSIAVDVAQILALYIALEAYNTMRQRIKNP